MECFLILLPLEFPPSRKICWQISGMGIRPLDPLVSETPVAETRNMLQYWLNRCERLYGFCTEGRKEGSREEINNPTAATILVLQKATPRKHPAGRQKVAGSHPGRRCLKGRLVKMKIVRQRLEPMTSACRRFLTHISMTASYTIKLEWEAL